MKRNNIALALLLSFLLLFTGCTSTEPTVTDNEIITQTQKEIVENNSETEQPEATEQPKQEQAKPQATSFDLSSIPEYNGSPYAVVNDNIPFFTESEYTTTSFEQYAPLDNLGRCGVAFACVGRDIMPTEERGNIGSVKPTGWQTVRYENVDGRYLYNRCHLLGFQLTGENANTRNLITGTRYMNVNGMLPFENMVADYVQETNKHALLRVTPIFEGNNLLATGVLMEALSMEDNGEGICFNVFCYNVQPGIIIDYSDGSNKAADGSAPYGSSAAVVNKNENTSSNSTATTDASYIGNKNTKKFHHSYCGSIKQMKDTNKVPLNSREQVINLGYDPCGNCSP